MNVRNAGPRIFQSRTARVCGYTCAALLAAALGAVLLLYVFAAVAIVLG